MSAALSLAPLESAWICRSEYVTVRDGTRLAAYVFLPTRGGIPVAGPLPTVWGHDRYHQVCPRSGRADFVETFRAQLPALAIESLGVPEADSTRITLASFPWAESLLANDYAIVIVDSRGSGASFGASQGPFSEEEQNDIYDLTEWIAAQSFSTGKVGMFGRSYLGISQYLAASVAPPHLVAIFPQMGFFDLYGFAYEGGVFRDDFIKAWSNDSLGLDLSGPVGPLDVDPTGALLEAARAEHESNRDVFEMCAALPFRDSRLADTGEAMYTKRSPASMLEAINRSGVAVYQLGGWYDVWAKDVLLFAKNLEVPLKVVMGPWSHTGGVMGGYGYNLADEHVRWFDHWLKAQTDADSPVMSGPAITYYTFGAPSAERWRTTNEWPLPSEVRTPLFLHAKKAGELSHEAPAEGGASTAYAIDYTTTTGTTTRWQSGYGSPFFYPDMAPNDAKALVFTTEPLVDELEITGHPVMHVFVTATASDVDLFVYLESVDESGASTYVTEGCIRASHRALGDAPHDACGLPYHRGNEADVRPLSGEPDELVIDLHPISFVFAKGSRLRIAITSADKDNALTKPVVPAPVVTLLADAAHLSRIVLPVIPRRGVRAVPADDASASGIVEVGLAPLSTAQARIWLTEMLGTAGSAYHMPAVLRLGGPVDVALLRRALDEIVQRHEVLRTTIALVDDEPRQRVHAPAALDVPLVDLSATKPNDDAWLALDSVRALIDTPWDLAREWPIRGAVYDLGDGATGLIVVIHHIAADQEAAAVLVRELSELYAAFARGEASPLSELPQQYAELARRERALLAQPDGAIAESLRYWESRLADAPPVLDLPLDRPRPETRKSEGGTISVALKPALVQAIAGLARDLQTSPFVVLLGGFEIMLAAYCNQEDVVVATPSLSRDDDARGLIGCFLNMLALRERIEPTATVTELVRRARATVLEALEHKDVPFEMLVQRMARGRDTSAQPLAQVCFTVVSPAPVSFALGPVTATRIVRVMDAAKFDLTASVEYPSDGAVRVSFEYATALFERGTIERMLASFVTIVEQMAAAPSTPIWSLQKMPRKELRRVIDGFNAPATPGAAADSPVHEMFAAQALRQPDKIAIMAQGASVSFAELDRRANRVANGLLALGAQQERIVALDLGRSVELVVAMLGVWKAGCAYLPISQTWSASKKASLFADANAFAVITRSTIDAMLADDGDDQAPQISVSPSGLAYVIQGVQVSHAGLTSFVRAMQATLALTDEDACFALAEPTLDAFVFESIAMLAIGARTIFAEGPESIALAIEESRATVVQAPPSVWHELLDAGFCAAHGVRLLSTGGRLPRELADRLVATGGEVWNVYGSTETTVWSTAERVAGWGAISIGKPIAGTRCYVLDRFLQPVPVGAKGELFIGGPGVARGYVGEPALTAERFVADPYAGRPDQRMVGTGALARFSSDGRIELLAQRSRATQRFTLSRELSAAIVLLGEREGTTVFETLLSAFAVLVGRYTEQEEATDGLSVRELLASTRARPESAAEYELNAVTCLRDGRIGGAFAYDPELVDASTVEAMSGQLAVLLQGMVENPDARIGALRILTEDDRAQVARWNDTQVSYPTELCVHDLFDEQRDRNPDAVAVVFEDQSLSYRELDARASSLAAHLSALGVGPEVLVGVCVSRSIEMVVAILGIMKAGGAYLPLDPAYPRDRLAFVIEDSGVPFVVTETRTMGALPAGTPTVLLDGIPQAPPASTPSVRTARPNDLAYVIYTSGSTGRPKGVEITHTSVVSLLVDMRRTFELGAGDTILAMASLSFDMSVAEILLSLACGSRLVVGSREDAADPERLGALLQRNRRALMIATPSTWRMLVAAGWTGSPDLRIIAGGEALPPELARDLSSRCLELWNGYGPTETTVFSTMCRIQNTKRISIGTAIANTQLHILGNGLRETPVGAIGELHIGGIGVGRGYRGRPELTRERFVPDITEARSGARMYRTGDLVRRLPDGGLEYLGRTDHQVKVRGHRIELGEIESALGRHESVKEVVVIAREDVPGDVRLVAYVVVDAASGSASLQTKELRQHLAASLPEHMIPAHFVRLDAVPISPNGKIDRKALPAPASTAPETTQTAPRTPIEQAFAEAWAEVLGLPSVGIDDNFFDLGGHSLVAVRAVHAMSARIGVRIPLHALFQSPTIAGLAARVAVAESASASPIVQLATGGAGAPLFCFHPMTGEIAGYVALAQALAAQCPVYGVAAGASRADLRTMATDYLAAVKKVQPQGPYRLAGWSSGGVLAFEVACQLEAKGDEASLVLFDAYLPDAMRAELATDGGADDRELVPTPLVRAVLDYEPACFGGAVLELQARDAEPDSPPRTPLPGASRGWRDVCRANPSVVGVPGDHFTMMKPPFVEAVATALEEQARGRS